MITHLVTARPYTNVMNGQELMQMKRECIGFMIKHHYPHFVRISRGVAVNPECIQVIRSKPHIVIRVGKDRYKVSPPRRNEVVNTLGIEDPAVKRRKMDALVLQVLADSPPLLISALSRRLGRYPSFVTSVVDRLASAGQVRKEIINNWTHVRLP